MTSWKTKWSQMVGAELQHLGEELNLGTPGPEGGVGWEQCSEQGLPA